MTPPGNVPGMDTLRCLLCGALFVAAEPQEMHLQLVEHQRVKAHNQIALARVRA